MTSDFALKHIKNFIAEAFTEYPRWVWTKGRIPQALAECRYYWVRLNDEDREKAWPIIASHARFAEKFSDYLREQDEKMGLL